jgi:hypothetical protein
MKKKLVSTRVKNGASVASLIAAILGLSACDDVNIADAAKHASKDLGVAITVNTDQTDVCARRQLVAFYNQFKKLSNDDQLSAKRLLHAKKAFNINATTVTGRLSGEATYLHFGKQYKILSDKRKLDGTAPRTQVEKGDAGLTVTTQGAVDESDKTNYVAHSEEIYDMIDAEGTVLQTALNKKQASDMGRSYGPIIDCGRLADIHELF